MTTSETIVLTPEHLVLFAVNTGELYGRHCAMARSGASTTEWWQHVNNKVLPAFRREVGPAVTDVDTRIRAAAQLKEYYERHVNEGGLL